MRRYKESFYPARAVLWLLLALGIGLGIPAARADPAAVTVNPVADAFVTTGSDGSDTDSNFGSAGALAVAADLAKGQFDSVMEFDLSSVKAGLDGTFGQGQWSVVSVTLQLVTTAPNNAIFNSPNTAGSFLIDRMENNTWLEGSGAPSNPTQDGITFDSLQNTYITGSDQVLGTFAFTGGTSGTSTYTLTLAPGLLQDIDDGDLLALDFLPADSSVAYLFNSRNFRTASSEPVLSVIAEGVPEPRTGALLLLALAAISPFLRCSRRAEAAVGNSGGRRVGESAPLAILHRRT